MDHKSNRSAAEGMGVQDPMQPGCMDHNGQVHFPSKARHTQPIESVNGELRKLRSRWNGMHRSQIDITRSSLEMPDCVIWSLWPREKPGDLLLMLSQSREGLE